MTEAGGLDGHANVANVRVGIVGVFDAHCREGLDDFGTAAGLASAHHG